MGKGGAPKNTTQTVNQNTIPAWAQPYIESSLKAGQIEATRPYQPYQGERLAPQSEQTLGGLNALQNYAGSGMGNLNNAISLSNMVGQQAMDLQNYEAGKVTNTYGGPDKYEAGQFNADQVGFGGDLSKLGPLSQQQLGEYMSPYMEDVVSASQRDAANKAAQEQAYLKGEAAKAGAFGGSRGGIQQQLAANAAQQRISDIGVQGREQAFQNAQNLAMQAAQGNQGAALQMALANQAKNLEAMGMGEQSRQFGSQLWEQGRQKAAELGMSAEEATEQLRQAGKTLGLQGLQLAGGTANQLANFQQMGDQMTLDRANALLGVGKYRDEYGQQQRDIAYQDFLNQQNYPLQRLGITSSILHGLPMGTNTTQTTTGPQGNPLQAAVGTSMAYDALQRLGRGTSS